MLRRLFSLPLFAGVLLLAGPAAAAPMVYDMTGSTMVMTNQVCAPCSVAVTGFLVLDDDGGGNVTLSSMSLSHAPYEVANPLFGLSVVLDRDAIGAVPAVGAGTTVNGVTAFGAGTLSQLGTATCTNTGFPCVFAGLPDGPSPLFGSVPVNLGNWAFDLAGNLSASFIYSFNAQNNATETLNLLGSPTGIPEPGTGLLLVAGLVGMALKRRAGI